MCGAPFSMWRQDAPQSIGFGLSLSRLILRSDQVSEADVRGTCASTVTGRTFLRQAGSILRSCGDRRCEVRWPLHRVVALFIVSSANNLQRRQKAQSLARTRYFTCFAPGCRGVICRSGMPIAGQKGGARSGERHQWRSLHEHAVVDSKGRPLNFAQSGGRRRARHTQAPLAVTADKAPPSFILRQKGSDARAIDGGRNPQEISRQKNRRDGQIVDIRHSTPASTSSTQELYPISSRY